MALEGKTVVITGVASGIGRQTALGLARDKAHVICVARTSERANPVLEEIKAAGGSAESMGADLSVMSDVRTLGEQIRSNHDRVHALINNAGVWQADREVTPDGFEKTWAVNVLAPHLLATLLLDPLRAANGRIVNVSSEENTNGRMWWDDLQFEQAYSARHAYRQSKLALTMLTLSLAERERGRVAVNCLHPGIVGTRLFRNFPKFIQFWIHLLMRRPAAAAAAVIRLATAPELEGVTGKFFNRFKEARPHGLALTESARVKLWDIVERQVS